MVSNRGAETTSDLQVPGNIFRPFGELYHKGISSGRVEHESCGWNERAMGTPLGGEFFTGGSDGFVVEHHGLGTRGKSPPSGNRTFLVMSGHF